MRRTRDSLILTVEHRAAAAPDPIGLALLGGDEEKPHLEITKLEAPATSSSGRNVESAILGALSQAPKSRTELRAAVQIRNERLGQFLTQLAATGRILRQGDQWTLATSFVLRKVTMEVRDNLP